MLYYNKIRKITFFILSYCGWLLRTTVGIQLLNTHYRIKVSSFEVFEGSSSSNLIVFKTSVKLDNSGIEEAIFFPNNTNEVWQYNLIKKNN